MEGQRRGEKERNETNVFVGGEMEAVLKGREWMEGKRRKIRRIMEVTRNIK